MRKLIATLLICVYLITSQVRPAEAFAPAIIAAGVLGGALIVAGGYTYYKPVNLPVNWDNFAKFNDTTGSVARVVIGAQMVVNQYGQEVLRGAVASAKTSAAGIQAAFDRTPAYLEQYDDLAAMFMNISGGLSGDLGDLYSRNVLPAINKYYSNGQTTVKITGITLVTTTYYEQGKPAMNDSGGVYNWWAGPNGSAPGYPEGWYKFSQYRIYYTPQAGPPPKTATHKSASELAAAIPGGNINGAAADELDAAIAANANDFGVSIIDSPYYPDVETAPAVVWPPYVPPVDAAQPTVTGLNNPGVAATGNALTTSQAQAQTQQAALDAYKASHPNSTAENDPTLDQMIKDLAAITAEVTANTKAYDNAVQQDKEVYPNSSPEPLKKLNFESLKALSGVLGTLFPFSLLSQASSMVDSLIVEPVAPSFVLPMPFGLSFLVDLSIFDPLAQVCRAIIGLILTSGVIYYVVRFWRGVS